jgi:hypothetical protein
LAAFLAPIASINAVWWVTSPTPAAKEAAGSGFALNYAPEAKLHFLNAHEGLPS